MKRVYVIAIIILLLSSVLWAQETVPPSDELKRNSIGLGFGIPYGGLGVNLDLNIIQNLNLSAGVGHTMLEGFGYNAGLKYFLCSAEKKYRPKVSAYYGINSIIETDYEDSGESKTESFTGFSFGVGLQIMLGKNKIHGFDYGIIFIATSDYEKHYEEAHLDELSRVSISFGYRFSF